MLASLSQHNLLRERSRDTYTLPGFTDKNKSIAIFAMVLGLTELVQNLCALWKLPSKIDTVKVLKKFVQLLRITFVALVKFPGNGKY